MVTHGPGGSNRRVADGCQSPFSSDMRALTHSVVSSGGFIRRHLFEFRPIVLLPRLLLDGFDHVPSADRPAGFRCRERDSWFRSRYGECVIDTGLCQAVFDTANDRIVVRFPAWIQ